MEPRTPGGGVDGSWRSVQEGSRTHRGRSTVTVAARECLVVLARSFCNVSSAWVGGGRPWRPISVEVK